MAIHPNSIVNYVPQNSIKEIHHMEFGDIYFLRNTIIAEIAEGMVYGWESGKKVIELAEKFYGIDSRLNYMANRIHDYTVIAQDWTRFFSENKSLQNFCIVTHGNTGVTNIAIERIFYKDGEIQHFTNLIDALKFLKEM
ncbi:hypothetical protein [Christiangramia sp. SM2212]|uniref:Uncharacterized protein n=1 Tax=Christiangramia sediminicola TaxID=3073267 RepID=A0ABU1EQH5_9FLAO|nr:hypothetical protein [Christiangramia sp. SM2212]MDR5590267.1 hypothetical protein [Christiangramia sp. SM2212]